MSCRATAFGANIEVMTRTNCTPASVAAAKAIERSDRPHATLGRRRQLATALALRPALSCASMSHVALVVPNASETVAAYATAFGASAIPALRQTSAEGTFYRGESTLATALWAELPMRAGFGLRIYQPVDRQRSWWFDGLQRFGPSIHLLSFAVREVNATLQLLALHGYEVLQRGPCYAYVDSLATLGLVLEVSECVP